MTIKTQAQRIVDRFGGVHKFCELTGFREDLVRSWLRKGKGRIEPKHHLPILIAARAAGIDLTPYDFIAHLVDEWTAFIASESRASQTTGSPASPALPA